MIRWITEHLGGSRAPEPEELKDWKKENVHTIINLLDGSYGSWLSEKQKEEGFEVIRIPSTMVTQFDIEEVIPVYDYIDELAEKGKRSVVHCKYGQARSGTFLAGYLIHKGFPYEEALNRVMEKGFLPQTQPQLEFLKTLAKLKGQSI